CLLAQLPRYPLTRLPTRPPAHLPTCLLACLPACLLAHSSTRLPSHLPTRLPTLFAPPGPRLALGASVTACAGKRSRALIPRSCRPAGDWWHAGRPASSPARAPR